MSNLSTSRTQDEEIIYKTQERKNLTTNNYDNINGNSSENYIENFTNLSNTEKSLVLHRVAQNLKTKPIRKEPKLDDDFNERILDLLKNDVYDEISQSPFTDNSLHIIKNDNILNKICNEIIDILHQWFNNKHKLCTFFNHSLPQSIRFVSWYSYLSNSKYREKFLNDLATHPRSVLSPMDSEIQRNSDRLIATLPSAPDMINSKGNMNAVKAILSYHRSLFPHRYDLVYAEYYYVIPIILSHNTPLASSEESYLTSLAILIEMYQTFLETMPSILRKIYSNNSKEELEPWFCEVENHLKNIDQSFYKHIQKILRSSPTYKSTIDSSSVLILLRKYCYKWFKYMFVGCLITDPLLFVWDQYLVTRNIPEFHNELLPAIATAIIIALKDLLMECKKTSEIEIIIQNKSTIIETHQLQSIIAQFFLPNLTNRITVPSNFQNQFFGQQPNNSSRQIPDMKMNPVYDFLSTITETCNRVVHGKGENNATLDEQTQNDIYIHKFDLKMAEREVTRKTLNINEYDALTFEQQQRYNQEMTEVMKKRIHHRYANELK
ncbi:unnamed protein product [Rotaria sordida]|uniref:Rab-GAP TBC domain-containing protein n=1 Tax=Rotaria sordida TaxID=392033 RepID=A0A813TVW6_9BILA|nr:unnamed protein product [Rotaria sordida]